MPAPTTKALTVTQFLASLPEDRRPAVKALRAEIRKNIDPKFKESMDGGMISWALPLSVYPPGYHCTPNTPLPFAALASQKSHIGIYLFCVYCEKDGPELFAKEWKATGKRLDMGKSCVRVKRLDDIPAGVVGRAIKRITAARFVASYEAALPASVLEKRAKQAAKAAPKQATEKRTTAKKSAAKKTTRKKATRKKAAQPKAADRKKAPRKKVARKQATRKQAARQRVARR